MIYHVTQNGRSWDGEDLVSLAKAREWSDELAEEIALKWPEVDPGVYYWSDGQEIHCHYTLAEAEEHAAECDGEILEIDTDSDDFDGRVDVGTEYPHPVVRHSIPAACVRRLAVAR